MAIYFYKPHQNDGYLDNSYLSPITVDNHTFVSVDHYLTWKYVMLFEPELEKLILVATDQKDIRLIRNKVKNYNEYGLDYSQVHNFYQNAVKQIDPNALYNLGISNASYNLGMLYIEGRGVDTNLQLGLHYLEKAVRLDNVVAKYQLHILQLHILLKNGLGDDPDAVINCYKEAARNNEPWAVLRMGKLYALGIGVKKNYAKAGAFPIM
jgi:TPR repeat protein